MTSDNTTSNETWHPITTFSLSSESGNDQVAMERVATAVQDWNLPPERLESLKTAVAEAALNGIEHGNRFQSDLPLRVEVLASARAMMVRVTDRGSGSILEAPEPDLEAKLAGRQSPRGWGLFLIRNMVDEVHVSGDEGHHTMELILYLQEPIRPEIKTSGHKRTAET